MIAHAAHRPSGLGPLGALAVADRMRRWWLRRLGSCGRVLVRNRELRVAVVFSTVVVTALAGTLVFPLWLLALGPMVWGVPHLVSDIRYLVVRTGYGRRRPLWLIGGAPLVWIAVGGSLVWGFVGAAAVASTAQAPWSRRLLAAGLLTIGGGLCLHAGPTADLVFGHVHNFGAVVLWWLWRKRQGRAHWLPLALLVAATALLLSPYALDAVRTLGTLDWHAAATGPERELWRLAPRMDPELGLRLVLLFCFMQSVHYALWITLLPDEARARTTVMTFRASYEDLRRDLGPAALVVASLLALGIATWAWIDLAAAGHGYFRMARFHGHLELMAGCLLVLERGARPRPTDVYWTHVDPACVRSAGVGATLRPRQAAELASICVSNHHRGCRRRLALLS